jgi:Glycosyl transferase family 2
VNVAMAEAAGRGRCRVSVVLCTFNGQRFLPELLASLASQSMPPQRLVLRDDGSGDDSASLVRAWTRLHGVALQELAAAAQPLGPARAFLTALAASPPADVHLLADQDDVWLPHKVERAARALQSLPQPGPGLYASRLQVVDQQLRPLRLSTHPGRLSFASAACESLLTGCTMALNEPLRQLAAKELPRAVEMHDWWLYLLASAAGRIVFDDEPTLLYRQHAQNALGAGPLGWRALAGRLQRALTGPAGVRRAQLLELRRIHGDRLPRDAQELVQQLVGEDSARAWSRLRRALTVPIARRRWLDRTGTRVALLRNRF